MFKKKKTIKEYKKEIKELKNRIREMQDNRRLELDEAASQAINDLTHRLKISWEKNRSLRKERDFYRKKLRLENKEDLALISLRILLEVFARNHEHGNETLDALRDKQKILWNEVE